MRELWFVYGGNSQRTKKIATVNNDDEAWREISRNLSKYNTKPPYYRHWTEDDGTMVVDFGSWSQFFYLLPEGKTM